VVQIVDIPRPSSMISSEGDQAGTPVPVEPSEEDSSVARRPSLHFDPHWLSITRVLAPYLSLTPHASTSQPFPNPTDLAAQLDESLDWVKRNVGDRGDGMVEISSVQTFVRTAPSTEEMPHDGPRKYSQGFGDLTELRRSRLPAQGLSN
jgi:hypothetical protein